MSAKRWTNILKMGTNTWSFDREEVLANSGLLGVNFWTSARRNNFRSRTAKIAMSYWMEIFTNGGSNSRAPSRTDIFIRFWTNRRAEIFSGAGTELGTLTGGYMLTNRNG